MPWGDRTGPSGMGPMTGRAAGYCAGYSMPGYASGMPRAGMWGTPYYGQMVSAYPANFYGFGRSAGFGRGWFGRGRGSGWFGRGRGWGRGRFGY